MGHAALGALADAGLTTDDVDGLFAASTQLPWASVNLGEWLGVQPRYSDSTQLGGSSFMAHLHHARAGDRRRRLRGGARRLRLDAAQRRPRQRVRAGDRSRRGAVPADEPGDRLRRWRPRATCTSSAPRASSSPRWRSPRASGRSATRTRGRKKDLTIDDVLARADGLRPARRQGLLPGHRRRRGGRGRRARERARELTDKPVYLLGAGEAHSHRHISHMPDLDDAPARSSPASARSRWRA